MVSNEPRIGILWPATPGDPAPAPAQTRWHRVFEELTGNGAQALPVPYDDAVVASVREQVLALDGVLVWVDPIVDGRNRSVLDTMLREVAAHSVFVSAHPDVILKMGTKEVLYATREMGWGTETRLYRSWDELTVGLPASLNRGARVLKQHRGNGGNGVWSVALADDSDHVRVQHALRGSRVEELSSDEFLDRMRPYFAGGASLIDQPYQSRLADGMIRCYLTHDRVVGFGHQMVTALLSPPAGSDAPPDPEPRVYFGPDKPEFQRLRGLLESSWIAEMQRLLEIETTQLPVIWDADFLLGPRTASGEDTYVLCEINVSSVFPIPDEAVTPLARAAIARALEARARR